MKLPNRSFRAILLALLTSLLVTAAPGPVGAQPVRTNRTISNVATIEWQSGTAARQLSSNRVEIAVEEPRASLSAYRFTAGSSSERLQITPSSCGTGSAPVTLATVWQGESLSPAEVTPTGQIRVGEPLLFALDHPGGNRDPGQMETVTAVIVAGSGDRETLTVFETGPDTGKFAGFIQTVPAPPVFLVGDCRLSLQPGDRIVVEGRASTGQDPIAVASIEVLGDRFGRAYDAADGTPVSGVRITLVDADTGRPALVFGEDGTSTFPSTVVTGSSATDSSGAVRSFPLGSYVFPFVAAGRYQLMVEPQPPYVAPSPAAARDRAAVFGSGGPGFVPEPGSRGEVFVLTDPAPVRVDIPLDRAGASMALTVTASRVTAEPGDLVQYQASIRNPEAIGRTGAIIFRDRMPSRMRLRANSARVGGRPIAPTIVGDSFSLPVPALAPGASATLTYVLEVRADAESGDAVNHAVAEDDLGSRSNTSSAPVRIRRDTIAARMTIIGRVLDGGCAAGPGPATGIAGVRIMLEDGSYSVTDADGRYHFEGVSPGLHVVRLDDTTLPADRALASCARTTRTAGRASSRFVDGQGGSLHRVDFRAVAAPARETRSVVAASRPLVPSDPAAAGAERDWLAGEQPGVAFLFPEAEHNPRARAVRVAVKHLPGQSVRLLVDGRPVDPVAFDGSRRNDAATVVVSLWRGIPLERRRTMITAEVRGADGALAATLTRSVHYSGSPMQAEILGDRSLMIADGISRPVFALRFTDRDGRPVRHGTTGAFEVPSPYYPAVEADAQQARQLAGLERASPFWRVQGEDGVALVELEPTTASGTVSLRFDFREGESHREQRVEAWLDPGNRPWTIVGLAAGTIGFNRLAGRMEDLTGGGDDVFTDGRLALYATGRIRGRWLMTLAYDSDRNEEEARFGSTIDPDAYYTVYADRSERRFGASSVRRLYLRLERPQFNALFGDFDTGIDEPVLTRYVRSLNGLRTEFRSDRLSATAFAADTPLRHRRDEIQGNGLTGPYALGARDLIPNSERVTIETRDRLRSDQLVESRLMTRHIDYDVDYAAGILRFRQPILSRSSNLDPQFIVVDYEVDGIAGRSLNAGGRVSWRTADQRLQVAATAIHDEGERGETNMGGVDIRYRASVSTEIRAEIAVSDTEPAAGVPAGPAGTATAWQIEAEHHGPRYDILAYAREREAGFGVRQLNAGENGTRRFGVDARARLSEVWALSASAWHEDHMASEARRTAGRALVEYRGRGFSARAGITVADDRLADGRSAQSTILHLGATRRFFDNRLELDAQTEVPLGGDVDSIDFPARHRLAARYALNSDVQLIGAYEIADGGNVDARTVRIGFDIQPWAGARIALTGNVQDIAEFGRRSFAAYGLSQSLVLDAHWSVDFSLDGNRTIGGVDPARVLNPLHPVASGGFLGGNGTLTEDFTAVTAGATYRRGRWSATTRAEYRAGEQGDRYGLTAAALRQIGEGSAVGGALNWFTASSGDGAETRTASLQLSWAHRPAGGALSWLERLELREDSATGAVAGRPGPIGIPFTISGDAHSRRLVNSLSVNWSLRGGTEASLFWGSRYVAERFGADDIAGWSNILGADLRIGLSGRVDVGGLATIRQGVGGRSRSYAVGPNFGFTPFENGWLSVGWNLVGFHDRDFSENRYTRSGPYVTMRLKFDQMSLQELGLGRR